ncbi:MAG: hypothetical protein Q7R95_01220, partial [bacterium]|nr:hypothetical protein [bacterium]
TVRIHCSSGSPFPDYLFHYVCKQRKHEGLFSIAYLPNLRSNLSKKLMLRKIITRKIEVKNITDNRRKKNCYNDF